MRNRPIRPKERFLVFGSPAIEEAEIAEVVASIRSGWLGTGPKVARFENDFKEYKGAKHAVAVNSCTAAIQLSILAAGIEPGDEIITTPMTFCATVNAIIHAGAVPVLADVEPATMNIDPELLKSKITPRTRAILPVHFAARSCDMDSICETANRRNLKVIEDCAHAIETEYKGRKIGTFGDFGCFSVDESKTGIGRDAFLDAMTAQNVGVGVHYQSIPEHPYYQEKFGWKPEDYPNAMRIGRQTVSLPISAKLTNDDAEDVIHAVNELFR